MVLHDPYDDPPGFEPRSDSPAPTEVKIKTLAYISQQDVTYHIKSEINFTSVNNGFYNSGIK